MNERIHGIARQTGYTWHVTGNPQMVAYYEFAPEELEKFAELIVQECARQVNCYEALNIFEHFGVEQ